MLNLNPALDVDYLQQIYGDDAVIINIMLETFLADSLPRWDDMGELLQSGQYSQAGDLAHGLKPSFSMVGLTWLHPKVEAFERIARYESDRTALPTLYQEISAELRRMKPILEEEVARLGESM
ncbi:Hpt domain-containing protein [Telluribacter sp.]|jgi:HPt (histidine-containing phosphotransfer) domain-containing protein|uniref:Hpt domain-containing protein n=1 Tax=Telluribacter sp. TaxID=1978767 RepID=UPI002E0D1CBC|nr:Hpt domain-containing protein [Telluribacter sp.]